MVTVARPRTARRRCAGALPASPITTGFLPGGSGFLDRTPAYAAKGVGGA
ncbi:hypothetical protein ACTXG6_09600 [Pseudonocardia sp. Cha107L01]